MVGVPMNPITGQTVGQGQTSPTNAGVAMDISALNFTAMENVYSQAGTLSRWFNVGGMDINASMDLSTADVNFEAIKALSPDSEEFLDVIAKYPDLKESVNDLLQDEGIDVLTNLQGLMTGEGKVEMSTLDEFLKDPTQRAMIVDAVDVAATDKQNTAALVEFARKGISAAANPMEEGMAFLDYADDYGIDTGPYRQKAGANLFANFWDDPKGSVLDLLSSMNLPPEWANKIAGFMAPFAEATKGLADEWLNGSPSSGPGILQLAGFHGNKMEQEGADMFEERRRQLEQQQGMSAGPAMG